MKKIFIIFLSALLLVSCASKNEYEKHSFFAMDTFAEVRLYSEVKDIAATHKAAEKIAKDIENSISNTIEESPVYKINSTENQSVELDLYLDELMDISMEMAEVTDGYFEPMSGRLVELWEKCENEQRLPTEAEISDSISTIYATELTKNENGVLIKNGDGKFDFGAIGKGYAADKMVEEIKANGVDTGMVTFVSTIAVFGERDFKIAVRTPDTSGETAGYITMRNEALSVSGDYERFYTIQGVNYNHIIDPHTGYPVSNGIHSVAVVCENAATADALSTAIFAMGVEKAAELYNDGTVDFEAVIITDDGVIITPNVKDSFELVAKYKITDITEY